MTDYRQLRNLAETMSRIDPKIFENLAGTQRIAELAAAAIPKIDPKIYENLAGTQRIAELAAAAIPSIDPKIFERIAGTKSFADMVAAATFHLDAESLRDVVGAESLSELEAVDATRLVASVVALFTLLLIVGWYLSQANRTGEILLEGNHVRLAFDGTAALGMSAFSYNFAVWAMRKVGDAPPA